MESLFIVFNNLYHYFFGVPLWSLLKVEKKAEDKQSLSCYANRTLFKKYWR